MPTSLSFWGGRGCPPSRCPLPSLTPRLPSVPHLHHLHRERSRCPPWEPVSSSPRFSPPRLPAPRHSLGAPHPASSGRRSHLSLRERGSYYSHRVDGSQHTRRLSLEDTRDAAPQKHDWQGGDRHWRSGQVQLSTPSEPHRPLLHCFTRRAPRPVTSARLGHAPNQPLARPRRGPREPAVESPK